MSQQNNYSNQLYSASCDEDGTISLITPASDCDDDATKLRHQLNIKSAKELRNQLDLAVYKSEDHSVAVLPRILIGPVQLGVVLLAIGFTCYAIYRFFNETDPDGRIFSGAGAVLGVAITSLGNTIPSWFDRKWSQWFTLTALVVVAVFFYVGLPI